MKEFNINIPLLRSKCQEQNNWQESEIAYMLEIQHDIFRQFHILEHNFKFTSKGSSTLYKRKRRDF